MSVVDAGLCRLRPCPDALRDGQGVCLPGRWSEPDVLGDGHGVWLGSWPSAPFPVPDESACVVRPYARLGNVVYGLIMLKPMKVTETRRKCVLSAFYSHAF